MLFIILAFILAALKAQDNPIIAAEFNNVGFDYRNGSFSSEDAKANAIFKFNYEQGKKYSTEARPELIWDVPDELTISQRESTYMNYHEKYFYEFSYAQSVKVSGFSFTITIPIYYFTITPSYSQEMGYIKSKCSEKINDIIMSQILYIQYYAQSDTYLFLDLSSQMQMFIDNLPREVKTEKDKKIIREFINKYGTHFAEDAHFGGKCHYDAVLKQTYFNHSKEEWCSRQFELKFALDTWPITIGIGIFHNKSEIHVDESFNKEASTAMFWEGGFLKYQTNSTLKEWKESIYDVQTATNASLTELWNLVEDEQKMATLKNYIMTYIEKGKIDELPIDNRVRGVQWVENGFDHVRGGKSRSKLFNINNDDVIVMAWMGNMDTPEVNVYEHCNVETFRNDHSNTFIEGASLIESRFIYTYFKELIKEKKINECKYVLSVPKIKYAIKLNEENLHFDQTFYQAMSNLPIKYHHKSYLQFLKIYGTKYVNMVTMGGEIRTSIWSNPGNSNALKDMFSKAVFEGAQNDLSKSLYAHGALKESILWSDFVNELEGREVSVKKWVQPITELIENETIKKNVEFAIMEYEKDVEMKFRNILEKMY